MNWYIRAMRNFAGFSGRARRKEYWYFVLFYLLGAIVLSVVDVSIGTYDVESEVGLLSTVFLLVHIVPALAVGVRRLHDRDMSGWWVLLSFLPLANLILLVFFVMRGTIGANRFGDDPLSEDWTAVMAPAEPIAASPSRIPKVSSDRSDGA